MAEETIIQDVQTRMDQVPIFKTLGIEFDEIKVGECKARAPHKKEYDGVFDTFHGGLLMTFADSIACTVTLTIAGANARIATTDMNIRFLRPCVGEVRAHAKCLKPGKTLCPVTIDLFDSDGEQVAVAQVTYLILESA